MADIPIQQDRSDRLIKIMRIDRSAIACREGICILITISTEREQCHCHHQISHRCLFEYQSSNDWSMTKERLFTDIT